MLIPILGKEQLFFEKPLHIFTVSVMNVVNETSRLCRYNAIMTTNMIIEMQQYIEENRAGIRKLPATVLKNKATGEVIYTQFFANLILLY